ncbi:terminase large subunit domain-containing protein [Herbaspirillum huttiense]|uniref:terminase large subunit domain-containing protein n=1 Tax=Herbaspirillum huttiense TaxID=863372 RepID=UPI003CD0B313
MAGERGNRTHPNRFNHSRPGAISFFSKRRVAGQIFTQYILHFAKDTFRVELSSDPMVLPNGVRLYFFRTNARTAQGYVTLPYLSPCK